MKQHPPSERIPLAEVERVNRAWCRAAFFNSRWSWLIGLGLVRPRAYPDLVDGYGQVHRLTTEGWYIDGVRQPRHVRPRSTFA